MRDQRTNGEETSKINNQLLIPFSSNHKTFMQHYRPKYVAIQYYRQVFLVRLHNI